MPLSHTSARALLVLFFAVGCGGRRAAPAEVRGAPLGDGELVVGAAQSGEQLIQIGGPRLSHGAHIRQVGFAAGGALVSAAGGHVRVWEPSGALRWQSFERDSDARFAVSGDGALVAATHARFSAGGRTTIYEVSGRERQSVSLGSVDALAFSPDAQRLVVVNPQLTVFDLGEGKRAGMLNQDALAVSFSDDDTVIAVSRDGVRRWSWRTGKVEVVQAFPHPPAEVALARAGDAVAWVVRDPAGGSAVHVLQLDGTAGPSKMTVQRRVCGLALSPLGDAVAMVLGRTFGVWTTGAAMQPKWRTPFHGLSDPTLAFSSTGQRLITGLSGGVATFEAESGAYERVPKVRTMFYDFDPSGDPLVFHDGQLWRVALPGGARTRVEDHVLTELPEWVSDFAHDRGGLLMGWDSAALFDCAPLRLWLRGAVERTLPSSADCDAEAGAAWFPGPGLVLTGGKRPRVWDAVKGKQIFTLPERSQRPIEAAFSVDGRLLMMVFLTEAQEEDRGHGYAGSEDGDDDGDGASDDEQEREAQAAMSHQGDGYDPSLEAHYVVEVVDLVQLSKLAEIDPQHWEPIRAIAWYEKADLDAAVILNDGTIFLGFDDGRVLAAAPGAGELREVARLTSEVRYGRSSPTGAVAAMTDDDSRTVLFSAAAARSPTRR